MRGLLTGRKIIVDTYGGAAPHGGVPSPARTRPRSIAPPPTPPDTWRENVVAAKLAERCTIQLSYAIGVAQPLSVYVDSTARQSLAWTRRRSSRRFAR